MNNYLIGSFDVGIKNLAICVLSSECTENKETNEKIQKIPKIVNWAVIDILKDNTEIQKCTIENASKKIKCTKKAKFQVENTSDFVCSIHSKKFTDSKNLLQLKDPKKILVKNFSIEKICKLLATNLNTITNNFGLLNCNEIIIELQPRQNRKMIQISNMIFSYFIIKSMDNPNSKIKNVKFIRATNKLKIYSGPSIDNPITKSKIKPENSKSQTTKQRKSKEYTERKNLAKFHTEYFLHNSSNSIEFSEYYKNSSKKDDLADCFLQGFWYLNSLKKLN